MATITRRGFTRRGFIKGSSAVAGMGAMQAFGAQVAAGQTPGASEGYGPLTPKQATNDPTAVLSLPEGFNFFVVSRQGDQMDDGARTPGIFDGTGAYEGRNDDETILIRNHENRRSAGEIPVIVPADKRYDSDPSYNAGDTKLVVRRRRAGRNADGTRRYEYEVIKEFAILGGTSTNCAGGVIGDYWYTCEEVVDRGASPSPGVLGKKHGYNFAIPAYANGPVKAVPLPRQGRFAHEAVASLDGILYETEDRNNGSQGGAAFYRFVPDKRRGGDDDDDDDRRGGDPFAGPGKLQALALKGEPRANMDVGRVVGKPYKVEWVDVDEPDHEDDTDNRRDRVRGLTPTRFQAQDKGAAIFDREEGIWTEEGNIDGGDDDDDDGRSGGKVYFDCTSGGRAGAGQVWEYNPRRKEITLIFESTGAAQLDAPDNLLLVPATGDIFLQEDGGGEQFIRGLTTDGEIYNFAITGDNDTEFCGGCFDEDGETLFVSQQGDRTGGNPAGQNPTTESGFVADPTTRAVTYAIYGPFEDRAGRDDDDDDDGDDD